MQSIKKKLKKFLFIKLISFFLLVSKNFDCSPDLNYLNFIFISQHTGDLFTSFKYLGLIFSKNSLIFIIYLNIKLNLFYIDY